MSISRGRIGLVVVAVVVVGVVVGVVAVAAVVLQSRGRVDPGTVVSTTDDVAGDPVTVLVPAGGLELTVGDPVGSVGDEKAPRGGAFVPVRVVFDAGAAPAQVLGALGGRPQATSLAIVQGGERHDLPAPYGVVATGTTSGSGTTAYVALSGTDHLRVEVTYDDLTQTVDVDSGDVDEGGAAGLYDITLPVDDSFCPHGGWEPDASYLSMQCTVPGSVLTPYDPDQGWSREGRTWLYTGLDLRLFAADLDVGARSVKYLPRGDGSTALSVDGRPAVRTVRRTGTATRQVFDVAVGETPQLHVETTQDLERENDDDPGPRDRTVTLVRDLRVPTS